MAEEVTLDVDVIRFQAQTYGIRTLIDGGVRLSLDIINASPELVAALFSTKQPGVFLEVAAIVVSVDATENLTEPNDETTKEATGSGYSVDSRRRSVRRNQ